MTNLPTAQPTSRAGLLALATRCEAANGPDRELDIAVQIAIGGHYATHHGVPVECDSAGVEVPRYSASLDAALSLAQPPGSPLWTWTVNGRESSDHSIYFAEITKPSSEYQGRGRTPALALTAASLRARAALA